MKAAVYYENGGPEVFKYEEVPDPPLSPHGVRIDVKAIAVEGGDVLNRAGGALASRPHVVGYNCAGIVRDGIPYAQTLHALLEDSGTPWTECRAFSQGVELADAEADFYKRYPAS